MIVPRHVLGAGVVAPSDKITFGAIGVGSKGTGDMRAWLAKDDVARGSGVRRARRVSRQSAKAIGGSAKRRHRIARHTTIFANCWRARISTR